MSRKVLVPIVLPANPVAPMEAATKQYVDALSGNEVFIGTAEPADPLVELWVDEDDIANPGDEVFVGPDDPISQAPNIELWYDTDDPTGNAGSIPAGGSAGQVLTKVSNTDYDDAWVSPSQSGTYTPVLTNCVVGTGGSAANTANYVFVGPPQVGAVGILYLSGLITFGTTGATLPQANPSISLPPGFQHIVAVTNRWLTAMTTAAGGFQMALVQVNNTTPTVIVIEPTVISASIIGPGGMSPTVPAAWAAGNSIRWSVVVEAVRV